MLSVSEYPAIYAMALLAAFATPPVLVRVLRGK